MGKLIAKFLSFLIIELGKVLNKRLGKDVFNINIFLSIGLG